MALSAYGLLIAVGAEIMLSKILLRHPIEEFYPDSSAPAFLQWEFHHFHGMLNAFVFLNLTALICSIGLLRRRAWAMGAFKVLLAVGILWFMGGAVIECTGLLMPTPLAFNAVMVILCLGLAASFYWILLRLRSPEVAKEFERK